MSVPESVEEIDRAFLWRTAGITLLWLVVIVGAGALLLIFQDAISGLFF